LIGTARGWATGHPSRPLTAIHEGGVANPILILDEIDKPGSATHNGHPWDALLGLLEPATASRIFDEFLGGHANLSFISWVATANSVALMPSTLLNRLQVITVDPPQPKHYPAIVQRCMAHFQTRYGIPLALMPELSLADWAWLERYYTSPRKVRRAVELLLGQKLAEVLDTQPRH
jgi:ATP-dependent Lon protease